MPSQLPPPVWIDNLESLQGMAAALSGHTRIAVDTEANSLYAYREQVCLIQFSTQESDYLADPLALPDIDLLRPIFAGPQIEKVFHDAGYDVLGLHRDHGLAFANIFDTKIAAYVLGYKAFGLGNLLGEKLGIKVEKRFQKADWGQRPLSDELVDYARLDTHYLIALRDLLEAELRERGRYELAREDFIRACTPLENGRKPARARWEKVKGHQGLDPRALAILDGLSTWREGMAERLKRPVFKVINDELLVALAQAAAEGTPDLTDAGLTARQVERFGPDLLQAIRRGREAEPIAYRRPQRPGSAVLNRLERLKAWRKRAAEAMEVESDVILPRTLMHCLAEGGARDRAELAGLMQETPWRFEHFGDDILKLIAKK